MLNFYFRAQKERRNQRRQHCLLARTQSWMMLPTMLAALTITMIIYRTALGILSSLYKVTLSLLKLVDCTLISLVQSAFVLFSLQIQCLSAKNLNLFIQFTPSSMRYICLPHLATSSLNWTYFVFHAVKP